MVTIQPVMNGFIVTKGDCSYICATYAEVDLRVRVLLKELTATEAQFEIDKVKKGIKV